MNAPVSVPRVADFTCEKKPATGSRGMVVTNHPLASAAGAQMLLAGGNAIDAAVASLFALTVAEPMMVGILGGGLSHIRLADGRHVVIDNLSTAPGQATADMYECLSDEIGKQRICPVIMLTAFSQTELVERARDAGVMAYIVKPFTAADLAPAIHIALSRWAELKELEKEVADLGEALETRKAVERAKGVLMKKLKLTEADAFRWIQKTAMDRRMGMKEVADAVIAGIDKA